MAADELGRLSALIRQRNGIEAEIASIIGRPAHPGHIGDFVAARIFDIELVESATRKAMDGYFAKGPLAGKSVNVKYSSKDDGTLNINSDALPDLYLVLTGPRTPPESSRGKTHPWVIESVFLFDAPALCRRLTEYGVKISEATSVRRHIWDSAEVYPSPTNRALRLTPNQRATLALFSG